MKYFAEDIVGVSFEFAGKAQVTIDGKAQQVDGIYRLASDEISALTKISFSETPKVVSPWVKSS